MCGLTAAANCGGGELRRRQTAAARPPLCRVPISIFWLGPWWWQPFGRRRRHRRRRTSSLVDGGNGEIAFPFEPRKLFTSSQHLALPACPQRRRALSLFQCGNGGRLGSLLPSSATPSLLPSSEWMAWHFFLFFPAADSLDKLAQLSSAKEIEMG